MNQSDAVAPINLSIETSFGGSANLTEPPNVTTPLFSSAQVEPR